MTGETAEQAHERGVLLGDKATAGAKEEVRLYLAQIGRKGGSAGTGPAKRRGDPEHYRGLAARSRKPTIKPHCQMTVHQEGTISFWSVLRQAWERRPAADIGAVDLATMSQQDRDAIARA